MILKNIKRIEFKTNKLEVLILFAEENRKKAEKAKKVEIKIGHGDV
jgi:hypothetical protein